MYLRSIMSNDLSCESTHGQPVAVTDTTAHRADATPSGVHATPVAPIPAPPPSIANMRAPAVAAAASCLAVPDVSLKASSGHAKPTKLAQTAPAPAWHSAPSCLEDLLLIDPYDFPHPPPSPKQLVPATIPNVKFLLTKYGIGVHYDVIKKKVRVLMPRFMKTSDNVDNVVLAHISSLAAMNNMPTSQIPVYVEALADANPFNPVADWIRSEPWDGVKRFNEIADTIKARDGFPNELRLILLYRWLLSCTAAAILDKGFKARGVLTLQGRQGCGKTSFFASLIPDPTLREQVLKQDHHLDGASKDSVITAISHWITEIGELDSSFKKDIARLKGILTGEHDKVRRPYARCDTEYPRRTVFCATVNASDFLVDLTGNARFWTIPVDSINYMHGINMQQLFAELALDVQSGVQWWLTPEEEALLDTCNRDHRSSSVIGDLLSEHLDLTLIGDTQNPRMSATEVLRVLGYTAPSNGQAKECAALLRDLLGDSKRIKGYQKWSVPLKPSAKANWEEFVRQTT